nr:MAG TPA: Single-strand binding protein-strand binding protein, DNA BINDING.8A [Bacteriophage sp.]
MKTKLETQNRIEVVGFVSNYVIGETSTGKKTARITIRDTLTKNSTLVTLFDRETLTYGNDANGDRKSATLGSLKKTFIKEDGKPRDVLITAIGSCGEYYSEKKGKTYDNNTVFSLFPCDDEEKQKSIFHLTGFVVSKNEGEDKDGEFVKLKIATYQTRGSYEDRVVTGVSAKTVIARGKAFEKLEDVEKGDFVKLDGDIINYLPKRDRFGNFEGDSKREYSVVVVKVLTSADDMEDEDLDFYKAARKLSQGETLPYAQERKGKKSSKSTTKKVEVEDDEDEDLDF